MEPGKFTVDTNLFRELGELLVGRDSMALVELVKNAYDADATNVIVEAHGLSTPETGYISIRDNGHGMDPGMFRKGFLTIAGRGKEEGERRSPRFKRRYTGEKGVGRLASHKLAHMLEVYSVPDPKHVHGKRGVEASIDWATVAECPTLDKADKAIHIHGFTPSPDDSHGTVITLRGLKRPWTKAMIKQVHNELARFLPDRELLEFDPANIVGGMLRPDQTMVRDARRLKANQFDCDFLGELDAGEDYNPEDLSTAHWLIEIERQESSTNLVVSVKPTKLGKQEFADAEPFQEEFPDPENQESPGFYARIFVRRGRRWSSSRAGINLMMEGFRVPPYGDPSDDWLDINADLAERKTGPLSVLTQLERDIKTLPRQTKEALSIVPSKQYTGAVFLSRESSADLKMLVNREGFLRNDAFDALVRSIRIGIGVSIRAHAAATSRARSNRAKSRSGVRPSDSFGDLQSLTEETVAAATEAANEARRFANAGDIKSAAKKFTHATTLFTRAGGLADALITEPEMTRVLAGIGTHLTSLIHEVRGLVSSSRAVERALKKVGATSSLSRENSSSLKDAIELTHSVRVRAERQATLLEDLTSPDSRRRRSRLKLSEHVEKALDWFASPLETRLIEIEIDIPVSHRTTPMFPAELGIVLINLLSNAIRACGTDGGKVHVSSEMVDSRLVFWVQNTGRAVDLFDADRWFKPFQTTSSRPDPVLGQGMGLGLSIVKNILEVRGCSIRFVEPDEGFATSVEVQFGDS
jgi:signal transduction histidine kinase